MSADPDGAHRAFRARHAGTRPARGGRTVADARRTLTLPRQIWLVAGRQARLFFADRLYLLFLAALPFALAATDAADSR